LRSASESRSCQTDLQNRFERFYTAYPRKRGKGNALKAFAKLDPDDNLLAKILAALELQKLSADFADPKFVPHPATWLNGQRWLDETSTAYTDEQKAVIEAYNAALSEKFGHMDAEVFSESRAGAIDDFMRLSNKPEFWKRYFPYVRDNCNLPPGVGFDYLIGRAGFTNVKGGQHEARP